MGSIRVLFNRTVSARAGRGRLGLLLGLILLLLSSAVATAQTLPQVLAARVSTTAERGRLVLDLSTTTQFAVASLDNPERIAIDVKAASVSLSGPPIVSGNGLIAGATTAMAEDGRARMLQDGGYPYLFHAPGSEIKTNFAAAEVEPISALKDATWYLVEAWDQS